MKPRYVRGIKLMLCSTVFLLVMALSLPAWATEMTLTLTREKYGRIDLIHADRDQAAIDRGGQIIDSTVYEQDKDSTEYSYYDETPINASETGTLDGNVITQQPEGAITSTDTVSTVPAQAASLRLDLDIEGDSYYGETGPPPKHAYNSNDPDPLAPGPDNAQYPDATIFKYYNNWDYTAVDVFTYSDFGGTGSSSFLVIDDQDLQIGESFMVTVTFSYGFDLSGEWSYQTVSDVQGTYDELTGFFYTSFESDFAIYDETGQEIGGLDTKISENLTRNDNTQQTSPITQTLSGSGSVSFQFEATEGVPYEFLMWANLYGHIDGIAGFDSQAWAQLDLEVGQVAIDPGTPVGAVPEPGTWVLLAIGIVGLGAMRKRIKK